ncbi:hypothetical protein C8Q79DRAFT_927950 [Trametes meyenii]|nr:hypothetical protein C8Q79DRAFT_927950 [Trametes meyenii]
MITEDAMEIYEEPDSSQSCSTVLLLREAAGKSQNDRRYAGVGWQCSSTNLALKRLREEYQRNLQPLGNPDSGRSDEHAPVAPRDRSLSRAPGDPKHPARIPRNTVYFPKTQDPEALEAKQLFKTKALGVQIQAIETAKLKAAKQHRLQQKENEDSSRRFTLRRRHTAEVAQPAPHPSRRKAALKGTITDLNVSYLRRRASLASEAVEALPPAPARSHPIPRPSQFPSPSWPYVMPTSTPSASQPRVIRVSQRWPPALGMRPLVRPGAGKYQVPRENPKAIVGFKVPFKCGAHDGAPVGAGAGVKRSQSSGARTSIVVAVPPRVTVSIPAVLRAPMVLETSSQRAEPVSLTAAADAMDEIKEADSSYGDIPFDFDPEALDEAMSMYDP